MYRIFATVVALAVCLSFASQAQACGGNGHRGHRHQNQSCGSYQSAFSGNSCSCQGCPGNTQASVVAGVKCETLPAPKTAPTAPAQPAGLAPLIHIGRMPYKLNVNNNTYYACPSCGR